MEEVLWEMMGEDTNERGLPPGFRFYPTDEELVTFYLAGKVFNGGFVGVDMVEIDLNRCEPWELPDVAKLGEREWYFYSLRDRKYPTGLRTNRATGSGYWKATGKDREVCSASGGVVIGMKKTLVFYKGRAPRGEKTKWVLHEYRLEGDFSRRLACKEEWVICRIFKKTGGEKKTSAFQNFDYLFDPSPSSSPLLAYPSLGEMQSLDSPMSFFCKGSTSHFFHPDDDLHRRLPPVDPTQSFIPPTIPSLLKSDSHQHLPKEINPAPEQCSSVLSTPAGQAVFNLVDADPQNPLVFSTFPPFFGLHDAPAWLGAAGGPPESGALVPWDCAHAHVWQM